MKKATITDKEYMQDLINQGRCQMTSFRKQFLKLERDYDMAIRLNSYIVRCKDCKYYQESKNPEMEGIKFCYRLRGRDGEQVGYNFSEDDFCSKGEKKVK